MDLSWLLPSGRGIPVLMYHKVWPGTGDDLTITPQLLREHLGYLKDNGYLTLSLPEYVGYAKGQGAYPEKSVLITFDDGYKNNLTYAYPLLKELGMKAVFFIVANTLHLMEENVADDQEKKMSLEELRSLDPSVVQLALHGYDHRSYGNLSPAELREDISRSLKAFGESGLPYCKVLAYPYGARPSAGRALDGLMKILKESGIEAAFRIGNKVSEMPAREAFQIKRIDIKGTDAVKSLSIKLKKGKLKPF